MHDLSVFSNITRLRLLRCLSESPKNVTDLISVCGLSQSAVSQHLYRLRSAGLVGTERRGRQLIYSLTDPQVAYISKVLLQFAESEPGEPSVQSPEV